MEPMRVPEVGSMGLEARGATRKTVSVRRDLENGPFPYTCKIYQKDVLKVPLGPLWPL